MPTTLGDYFSNFGTKVGDYVSSDRAMAELPMIGAAIMGEHQDEPIAMVNRILSGIGQSTIAAKKASEQEAKQDQMFKLLMSYLGGGETRGQTPAAGFTSTGIRGGGAAPAGPKVEPIPNYIGGDVFDQLRLSEKNIKGPTKVTKVRNPDGTTKTTIDARTEGIDDPVRAPQQQRKATDILPFY